jgi:polyhydroxyalkanoate synthesis repressor PhaR
MSLIKRYPNRKLYDTEAKQYITLDGIAALIRQGEEVTVVDHASGEDLTALTLSQIIFEQEKKHSGFLPRPVLTGLVQAGGDTLGTLRHIDEEIEQRIRLLISRGELAERDGLLLLDKLLSLSRCTNKTPWPSEYELEQMLIERGVPTSEDLEYIVKQLDWLAAKLDEISTNTESV